ncbi:MAG: AarF/ABC1/UbiB kinase family protein [Anaerolineales bacterium]|nr:AarF/ABC1/UbiB kinase family protein [Anaerolineales bacterium]
MLNSVSSPILEQARIKAIFRRHRWRYVRLLTFYGRLAIGVLFWDIFLRRLGMRSLARRTAGSRYGRAARRFRELAVRLGGIWIKVGQFLSARVDVLPKTIIDELSGLQDEVPAESSDSMLSILSEEFEGGWEECFSWFDPEPLASASLGQVHRARLHSGEDVVVKVQRPQIDELIMVDLTALEIVIGWLKRVKAIARRVDLDALVAEFSRTVWEEIDYLAEADNARRFGEMYADDALIRIPKVYGDATTKRALTLEDVYFIKITDYEAIEEAGVDLSDVAHRLFKTYLHQIFEVGFFHADPHPGNLFVEPLEGQEWRLVFVDFGMVGHLKPQAKDGLRDLAIAVATKDADRLVSAYQSLGMILPGANLDRIREAEAMMFDRFWGMSMQDLTSIDMREMHNFAREYRDLLYEMPFQLPSDLIFLGRCVAILSGMCTGLNPEFNLFKGLLPYATSILGEGGEVMEEVVDWIKKLALLIAALPGRIDSVLGKLETGDLVVTAKPSPGFERRLKTLTRAVNRLVAAVVFLGLLLSGTLLYLGDNVILGGVFLGFSILSLAFLFRR